MQGFTKGKEHYVSDDFHVISPNSSSSWARGSWQTVSWGQGGQLPEDAVVSARLYNERGVETYVIGDKVPVAYGMTMFIVPLHLVPGTYYFAVQVDSAQGVGQMRPIITAGSSTFRIS